MTKFFSVILAAGKGTRMKSRVPKVLHKVCGKPMLAHVIDTALRAGVERNIVIIGHGAGSVRDAFSSEVEWAYQQEQLGTGHAVMQAEPILTGVEGSILILCGDTPLLTENTLRRLMEAHTNSGNTGTVLTAIMENPAGYGRIIRDGQGMVQGIVEHKDADCDQLKINEINTGVYCFETSKLFQALKKVSPANAQGEYYLTDVLSVLREDGDSIGALTIEDQLETMGINDRSQLAQAEKVLRERILYQLMADGVTIVDPQTTYIDRDVVIGNDTIIYPGTFIEGSCKVGSGCQIGPYSRLKDVETGDFVTVQNSVVLESSLGNDVNIGPFAYIRPGTILNDNVKVGDFVEIKKSVIGKGSKVPHLSYVGDAEIGEKVNVGAGTITCNYDGVNKSKTLIGDNAFIGSNSNLVAPVKIGSDAVIGAGSTVTKSVPEGALCVERSKQVIYSEWKTRKNKKK